jgi:hypothetical protein
MMLVNRPVVLIGKWNPGPGAMSPLVDATFDLLAFEKTEGGDPSVLL